MKSLSLVCMTFHIILFYAFSNHFFLPYGSERHTCKWYAFSKTKKQLFWILKSGLQTLENVVFYYFKQKTTRTVKVDNICFTLYHIHSFLFLGDSKLISLKITKNKQNNHKLCSIFKVKKVTFVSCLLNFHLFLITKEEFSKDKQQMIWLKYLNLWFLFYDTCK